eukprot:5746189-Prymnesium_polylepis.2
MLSRHRGTHTDQVAAVLWVGVLQGMEVGSVVFLLELSAGLEEMEQPEGTAGMGGLVGLVAEVVSGSTHRSHGSLRRRHTCGPNWSCGSNKNVYTAPEARLVAAAAGSEEMPGMEAPLAPVERSEATVEQVKAAMAEESKA